MQADETIVSSNASHNILSSVFFPIKKQLQLLAGEYMRKRVWSKRKSM
jgi:hypothetical protein